MTRTRDPLARRCWIDLFQQPYFGGKMRRLFGPVDLKKIRAASLIVGPGAHVLIHLRKSAKLVKLKFPPNRLEPDLAARLRRRPPRSPKSLQKTPQNQAFPILSLQFEATV